LHEASPWTHVGPQDIEFVQSISSHSCAFRLRGASSVTRIAAIIEKGRVVLEAAITSTIYVVTCCVSFSFYSLFSLCAPQSSLPTVPILGSSLFILLVLPILGLTMAMSEGDDNVMNRVPPKNEQGVAFAKAERTTFYSLFLSKAILPALLPQILHPIVFGELMLRFEADVLGSLCPAAQTWSDVARCDGLRDFVGQTKSSADTIVFAQFALCTLVASTGYVHRYLSVRGHKPWERNVLWLCSVLLAFGLLVVGVVMSSEKGTIAALPWYYFVIASITPPLCLFWVEQCKQREAKLEKRAEKLRRLQFETRLGAWSPR
jgi:magnesium-transporting ATPase (P-type)